MTVLTFFRNAVTKILTANNHYQVHTYVTVNYESYSNIYPHRFFENTMAPVFYSLYLGTILSTGENEKDGTIEMIMIVMN